ncbi:CAP domain-containing protein [Paenibacillus sp. sgz500958]|uniref:CAP domain-containing protein n=1 Tax=Paenibacillus sp. sgz500958 TaxID=3242475 RepID=UPI0036D42437
MKSNALKALLGGSISAVMALGITLPAGAGVSAASANDQAAIQYQQVLKYIQTYYSNTAVSAGKTTYVTVSTPQATVAPVKSTTVTTTAPAVKPATSGTTAAASTKLTFTQQVVVLVNKERSAAGLSPVTGLDSLNKLALTKATDMRTNNYFSHTSPTYGSPFDMMKSFGISYKAAGENIAMGQRTPEEVMKAWMNSPGHRANILSKNFNYIGVGFDNNYWVQEFIGK